jgi:hypothetical protein
MDHEILVRVANRVADLEEQLEPLVHAEPPLVAVGVDRLALDVLHHQVGQPILGRAAVDQAGDARVVERRERLPLAAEALEDVLGIHAPLDDLDRHALREVVVGARGEVHRPIPPEAIRRSIR